MALTVTATATNAFTNGINCQVMVLTGAAATQNGATGASAAAYQAAVTPHATGSRIYGALLDDSAFTANAATTIFGSTVSGGISYASCKSTATTTSGTPVTIGASAPAHVDGGVALLEVLGTTTEDGSAPADAINTGGTSVTTASFTPPAGSLLVALVGALVDLSTGSVAVTDTSGLTWTQKINCGGTDGYAGVWTAQVPSGGITGTGSLRLPPLAMAGAGTFTPAGVTGTGSLRLPPLKMAGAGTFTPAAITGTGSLRLPPPAMAGAGTFTPSGAITGTGSLRLPPPAMAGTNIGRSPLLISLASRAGTDDYGNAFPEGLSVGAPGGQQVRVALSGTEGFLEFPSGAAFEQAMAQIAGGVQGVAPAQFIQLVLSGASDTLAGAHDQVFIELNSAAADNSSDANMELIYKGSNGNFHLMGFMDSTGFNIVAGQVTAVHPGSNPATPESWQFHAAGNGWTGTVFYKMLPTGAVRIVATLNAPASSVNGVAIVTLPAGYRPLANIPFGVQQSAPTGFAFRMTLATDGTLQSGGVTASSTVWVLADVPVDL